MEDDLIVVDDVEDHAGPSTAGPSSVNGDSFYAPSPSTRTRPLRSAAEHAMATNFRRREGSTPPLTGDGRATRSSTLRQRPQPKLKLKLSDKAAAQAPGMSFLGAYDRELDSDDEDLAFEEQFVLRMPPGEDCEKLRKMVHTREVENDVWFKFKDSRRAVFHIGNSSYSSKLVDLPCIIESHKTLDNKQMFKVADICQMLVVDKKIESEESIGRNKNFNIDEFIWPHGITPPLHHVRKRRFRKRVNKRTIESVEEEVERLLGEDAEATQVKYDILDNVNPDLSDSEFIEHDEPLDAPTPFIGSDVGDAHTPGDLGGDDAEEEDEHTNSEGDGDIDEELAAELDLALGDDDDDEEGDDEDEDEDEDDESEEEDEDDDDEAVQARKLLNEEISDLEAAVRKKGNEIASSANPLIRRRFEDALKKLTTDLEMKLAQRDELKELQRLKKEGLVGGAGGGVTGPGLGRNGAGGDVVDDEGEGGDDEDDDLFGDEDSMDVS